VEITRRALRDAAPACRLNVAGNGEEALDYLLKSGKYEAAVTPQLILLDINMPRMNGKELLRAIKQHEALAAIPVVMLTSSRAPLDIMESYALHASCYIVKPFDGKEFMNVVGHVVGFWRDLVLMPHEAASL
jgi:chemotaxis family two-component system response regulator Rcp1